MAVLGAAVVAVLLASGIWFAVRATMSGSTPNPPPPPTPRASAAAVPAGSMPAYRHVFLILMENHGYPSIVGSPSAPYINGTLIADGALAANYHAITHPSLPNYVALTAGQTAGIHTDCNPGPGCTADVRNLGDELERAGKSWKAYEESIPAPCTTSDAGQYAVRHDPFVYFDDVRSNAARCAAHVVPLPQLQLDTESGLVPSFSFITPNLLHDMHDGTVREGDVWLQQEVPGLLSVPSSLVIVTWDEAADDNATNQVATLFDGAGVAKGAVVRGPANHYSLLHTVETLEGVTPLTMNDAGYPVMTGMFAG
ncbi:MAG: alkaline phosphatase family protein [Candidatus Dormiibacterota bacterium]